MLRATCHSWAQVVTAGSNHAGSLQMLVSALTAGGSAVIVMQLQVAVFRHSADLGPCQTAFVQCTCLVLLAMLRMDLTGALIQQLLKSVVFELG